jgi:uncharacterized membrane protein
MNNTTNTSSDIAAVGFDGHSVIAVAFEDDRSAYKALTVLKELDAQDRVDVREAVVVTRGEDGQVVTKDEVTSTFLPGTAGGGLIGLLVGIIGGPLGMLLGGSYGLLAGSLFDLYDADETGSALSAISSSVKPGRTALLAVVEEQSVEVVDTAMTDLGGTVLRRAVADVEAEIAAAEEAESTAKQEARKELNRAHRERDKAAVDAKLEDLKAKLHHGQPTGPATADSAAAAAPAGS